MVALVPVRLPDAYAFVRATHRHLPRVVGGLHAVGVGTNKGRLVGVAIMGRPVAAALDDGLTLEVTRCAVKPRNPNACSMLYGAARRAAKALGYQSVITYTRSDENGASLRAAGFVRESERDGKVRWVVRFVPRSVTHSEAEAERRKAITLKGEGLTVRAIAQELGRSKSHVGRMIQGA